MGREALEDIIYDIRFADARETRIFTTSVAMEKTIARGATRELAFSASSLSTLPALLVVAGAKGNCELSSKASPGTLQARLPCLVLAMASTPADGTSVPI